jgi:hypothetical protein
MAFLGGWADVDGVSRTLDDETTGESSMSVSWCCLARHDELQTGIQSVGSVRSGWRWTDPARKSAQCNKKDKAGHGLGLTHRRVDEHEYTTLGLFLGDDLSCADEVWLDDLVTAVRRAMLRRQSRPPTCVL